MKTAYIVSPFRSAVGKAYRGSLAQYRPDSLAADVIKGTLERTGDFPHELVEDVIMGCAMPEGEQGMNVARYALLLAGMPEVVPGVTVNRFCSSGVQTIAMAAHRIQAGDADCIMAGGVESMSLIPMGGNKFVTSRRVMEQDPDFNLSMGLTAENVAEDYGISREDQDQFSVESHQKASNAIETGLFKDEIIPLEIPYRRPGKDGSVDVVSKTFAQDEGPRPDTSMEALARLRAVFKTGGSVTAGNASQMSDGAAMCLVCSEDFVKKHNLEPIARFVSYSVKGVPPRVMGIGPIEAIPDALKKGGVDLKDVERIELNEAFAAQSLAILNHLKIDKEIVNPTGGAIALGHPLGATGAKLTATLLHGMKRDKQKYGLVTMCIGTGMGAACLFENLN